MKKKIAIVISSIVMAFIMTASVFSIITFAKTVGDKSDVAIEIINEQVQPHSLIERKASKLNNEYYIVTLKGNGGGTHFNDVYLVNIKTRDIRRIKGY